jgi:hypothetical protein
MIWFGITTVLLVALLLTGMLLATHTYDHQHKHLPH